jgi:hypothetical protein
MALAVRVIDISRELQLIEASARKLMEVERQCILELNAQTRAEGHRPQDTIGGSRQRVLP